MLQKRFFRRRGSGLILNIGKLRGGSTGRYYTESVARSREDYYVGSGEAPGRWTGSATAVFGASGEVSGEALRAVLQGVDPSSGERLAANTRADRVPGFDLTFRAPKSVSLVGVLGSRDVGAAVTKAHEDAVDAAVAYLERHACAGRKGANGIDSEKGDGFVAAAFRHRTSRAGDPLLHTHVLVANLVRGSEGKWRSLDAKQLYAHAKTAGFLYQAQLREGLTRALGVGWTSVHNGTAEIEGVERSVIKAFSRRREEIKEHMAEHGTRSQGAAQASALETRKAKDYGVSIHALLPEWRERAAALGLSEAELAAVVDRATRRPARLKVDPATLTGPEGLTQHASTFGRRELIQSLCEQAPQGAAVEAIEALADSILASPEVIPLAARLESTGDAIRLANGKVVTADKNELRYSTPEMLATEEAVIAKALQRQARSSAMATPKAVEAALAKRPELAPEQRAMVRRLTTSGNGVDVVIGPAGTGKTTALEVARDAWESSGHRVIGCALAAQAASQLRSGAGIPSYTIDRLLIDLQREGWELPANAVVVVDEAGMVGTRKLERLLDEVERAGAKAILVGDDRQLPEIAAGGAFRGIKNRGTPIELTQNRRQRDEREREALGELRSGDAGTYIARMLELDRVTVGERGEEVRAQLVRDWYTHRSQGDNCLMVASRNADVDDLNERARSLLREAGELGETELIAGGRSFAPGDYVMTLENDTRVGVLNGTRAVVEAVDPEQGQMQLRLEDGSTVELPQRYVDSGMVTHAYANTAYKAQGVTVDRTMFLGDDALYRELAYTAASRGRIENRFYVVAGNDPARDDVGGALVGRPDAIDGLVRSLERSRAKDLALDAAERSDIAVRSTPELVTERERLRAVLAQRPAETSGELQRLENEKADAQRLQAHYTRQLERAERELSGLRGRRQRQEAAEIGERVASSSKALENVTVRLFSLEQATKSLQEQMHAGDAWLRDHATDVARYSAVATELRAREHLHTIGAEASAAPYLAAVGEDATSPARADRRYRNVRAVEGYRTRFGVTDEKSPVGAEPKDVEQRTELRRVQAVLQEHGREIDERGLQRRM